MEDWMCEISRRPAVALDQALLDPSSIFASPEELLARDDLPREEKIEILRRWAYDASEMRVAAEEGMPDGDSDLLQRILLAIGQLGVEVDLEQVGPTKHHGIPRSAVKSS
jgi:hypothetical protein